MVSFTTHDNGGRPYKVEVSRKVSQSGGRTHVRVIRTSDSKTVWEGAVAKVFVGESRRTPLTLKEHTFGPEFRGNTILLQLSKLRYVFIGGKVMPFKSKAEIVRYSSPVGRSDVPYPFAVDADGRCYLLTEHVVATVPRRFMSDPYAWFYMHNTISPDITRHPTPPSAVDLDVRALIIDGEAYTLPYSPNPEAEFQRLGRLSSNGRLYIETNAGRREPLTRQKFMTLQNTFARQMGLFPLSSG